MIPEFLADYLDNSNGGECSKFTHTWSCVGAVAAALGRNIYLPFGQGYIYPNLYIMLVGEPASKKSAGIKLAKKLLAESGYTTFVADSASREKFLSELAKIPDGDSKNIHLENLKLEEDRTPAECFMAIDEFRTFMGVNNEAFISLLTDFWDRDADYFYKIKTGTSFKIVLPTINLLGGTTAGSYHAMFPPAIAGQGFSSRLLLIHSTWNGTKIAFPPLPDYNKRNKVVNNFAALSSLQGVITLSEECRNIITEIYMADGGVRDGRFNTYNSRRQMQLFKLCIISCAMRGTLIMSKEDIVFAHTLLTYTESLMPKVLGEYGASKYSEVAQKIIDLLNKSLPKPMTIANLLREVSKDLDNGAKDLLTIMTSLIAQGKVSNISGGGYLPINAIQDMSKIIYTDTSILNQLDIYEY